MEIKWAKATRGVRGLSHVFEGKLSFMTSSHQRIGIMGNYFFLILSNAIDNF